VLTQGKGTATFMTSIYSAGKGFKVLETTRRSQTASMTLEPGESSSKRPNTHSDSDQVLIVLEGKVTAEISGKSTEMNKGDAITVRAGTPHKFTNAGSERAVTFSVYSPPAY
jgi:mannose-6-phosphate isomerase-like protein (cupin superfamily)